MLKKLQQLVIYFYLKQITLGLLCKGKLPLVNLVILVYIYNLYLDHVALIIKFERDGLYVLDATSEEGVSLTTWDDFIGLAQFHEK